MWDTCKYNLLINKIGKGDIHYFNSVGAATVCVKHADTTQQ